MHAIQIAVEVGKRGYVIVRNPLSAADVAGIKLHCGHGLKANKLVAKALGGFRTGSIYALLGKDPVFSLIVEHLLVFEILYELLLPTLGKPEAQRSRERDVLGLRQE